MVTKDEVFEYVMNTPGNTNPAVLRSLLDGVEGESSNVPCTKLSVIKPQEIELRVDESNLLLVNIEGKFYKTSNISEASYVLSGFFNNKFYIEFVLDSFTDDYIVALNDQEVPYTQGKPGGGYLITYDSEIYPTEFNIVITNR